MQTHSVTYFFFLIFFICFPFLLNVNLASGRGLLSGENPLTPKASLIRYWNKVIHNKLPKSPFILSKASPLNAIDAATFSKLASKNALSTKLPDFCSSAKLYCFPESSPKHDQDTSFARYVNRNFINYGNEMSGGVSSFKNYSDNVNIPVDSFRVYGRGGADREEKFSNYAPGGNIVDESFSGYGTSSSDGKSDFKNYAEDVTIPNLRFTSYSDEANDKEQSFTRYSGDTNTGNQKFTNYGINGNGVPTKFTNYGENSNVLGSNFNNYGDSANEGFNKFTSYGFNGNIPENNFNNYGAEGNSGGSSFTSYRDKSNVGDDTFQSYAKGSNSQKVDFKNYGKSVIQGTDTFKGYGEGASGQEIGFKIYGVKNTFKGYAKTDVTFAKYTTNRIATATPWVEPGKFFREFNLKKGTVMSMPDIIDKMPKRSFLPRSIISKLPFSTSKFSQLKQIFNAFDNSTMETLMLNALTECERAPSPGETKRCVGSAEDMIDFATSVLGRNVVARTTENVSGSKNKFLIGSVKGINGGKVTKSVSCHQSLYPYLLYYCHSVPKVRVYEADILDPNSTVKINHGVAICHLDTSSWSPTHGSFIALGSGPGRIEVCHWIFENDLTWTTAD